MSNVIIRDKVYEEYKDRVYCYIKSKVANPHDIEDLLSCVFLKVYQKFDSYESSKSSLSTWIYTITHNEVCNYYRTKSKQDLAVDIDDMTRISDDFEDFTENLIKEEELESLAKALESLPPRERDIIILRFYHRYTGAEVAKIMKISYSNAKFLQHRAVGMLRKAMGHER